VDLVGVYFLRGAFDGGCSGACRISFAMIFGNIFRWRQFIDQPLHMAWAALALFPVAFWGVHWWTGALAGLLIDLPRELVSQWPISRQSDFLLDLAFFAIGGALIGGLL